MFGAHLGNGLTRAQATGSHGRVDELCSCTEAPEPRPDRRPAPRYPVQVNAWDGSVSFTDRKAVPIVEASEKMPFRVTPVIPYLRTLAPKPNVEASVRN